MKYTVRFSRAAVKMLAKVPEPYYSAVKQAIIELADNPRPAGCKKLKETNAYRIRVNHYRVIYDISDNVLNVDIIAIGHRKDIYR